MFRAKHIFPERQRLERQGLGLLKFALPTENECQPLKRPSYIGMLVTQEFSSHLQRLTVQGLSFSQLAAVSEHSGQVTERRGHFRVFRAQELAVHLKGLTAQV